MEVQFFGNVGKDAEVKTTQENREQVVFTVAENLKRNGQEMTNWLSCYYGNTRVAQYLKKGTKVFVRGELSVNIYQTNEGETRVGYTVFVNKLEMLGGQQTQQQNSPQPIYRGTQPSNNGAQQSRPQFAGDLPFGH